MDWSEHFYYDETSPSCLRWARSAAYNKVKKHDVAGVYKEKISKPGKGYYMVYVDTFATAAHRVIWQLFNGFIGKDLQIDHIDGTTTNNRIINLRVVSNQVNCYNQAKRKTNKTGVTGVHIAMNKGAEYFVASWMEAGKRKGRMFSINKYGYDKAFELAKAVRDKAVQSLKDSGLDISERHGK